MPVRGLKFISEFLLPNLNSQRFGTRLMWLNVKYSIFQVQWCHKSAADWTSYDAEVFMEWDKVKGRCHTDDKERFSKSKQRFRAIIYKLVKGNRITELCNDKYTKIYSLGTKKSIPNEIIEKALQSRESREKSLERIYRCDPETLIDFGEISGNTFLVDNQTVNIMEDHKYANPLKEIVTESEDTVPDNQVEQFNSSGIQHMYIDLLQHPPDKHGTVLKLEDSSLEYSNGSNLNCTILCDDILWRGSSEFIEKYSNTVENQSLTFAEVWNNSQL